jgi:hypothetical protein
MAIAGASFRGAGCCCWPGFCLWLPLTPSYEWHYEYIRAGALRRLISLLSASRPTLDLRRRKATALRCSVRHTTAAWRRTHQHAQGELGRAQGTEDRYLRHGKRRSYARARAPARRARVAKEEPETVAENAPLGTAPAAPGITRPTPGRRRAPRVVRAGILVSWGVRSVLTAVRRHGATSNPGAGAGRRGRLGWRDRGEVHREAFCVGPHAPPLAPSTPPGQPRRPHAILRQNAWPDHHQKPSWRCSTSAGT